MSTQTSAHSPPRRRRSVCGRGFLAARAIAAAAAHADRFPAERASSTAMTLVSLVPLFSVVLMLLWRGGQKLSLAVFTQLPPAPLEQGGGFGNAIVGTLMIVALAVADQRADRHSDGDLSGRGRSEARLAEIVRFCAKVLTGFPSILAGVFAYGAIVLTTGGYLGACRRGRAVDPDAADHHPDRGRRHPHGAAADEGSRHRHGRHAHAGGLDGAVADGAAGHSDRRDAGGRARRRRDRAAPVHRAVQQLLAVVARPRAT